MVARFLVDETLFLPFSFSRLSKPLRESGCKINIHCIPAYGTFGGLKEWVRTP